MVIFGHSWVKKTEGLISLLEADSDLVCQPGVGWVDINETLKDKGIPLFFPV
jgi:D-lactate dehydrogenase (cytochrome)